MIVPESRFERVAMTSVRGIDPGEQISANGSMRLSLSERAPKAFPAAELRFGSPCPGNISNRSPSRIGSPAAV